LQAIDNIPVMQIITAKSPVILSYTLLILVVFTMFFVTLFPLSWHGTMYDYLFKLIYLNAALTMDKFRKQVIVIAVAIMVLEFVSSWLDLPVIIFVSKAANIVFFIYIVFNLIYMIARSRIVNTKVILESINGYLLLGLVFTLLITIAMRYDPTSFNFPDDSLVASDQIDNFTNFLYYGLVTLTTLGYGDIVPTQPFSRSLATLTSITGQLYIAIIIAMLVGKYAGQKTTE
jgi:hypothetical protein